MSLKFKRCSYGYSLIETMTVLAVLGIVIGLLYAYSNNGWRLFYQSYSRGLSQIKAKLAVKLLTNELREANGRRIYIGRGASFGIPLPDDLKDNSPFIYFTKPVFLEKANDVIGYDYILYYFAKPKLKYELQQLLREKRQEQQLVLKTVKFKNQSKFYTEDEEKIWPFMPPILELYKSQLPEDESYIQNLKENAQSAANTEGELQQEEVVSSEAENSLFLDHFARLKKVKQNIPISGNFTANSLTDPFLSEKTSFLFGQDYKSDELVTIKVILEENPVFLGLMAAKSEFEVKIKPRN